MDEFEMHCPLTNKARVKRLFTVYVYLYYMEKMKTLRIRNRLRIAKSLERQ